MEISEEEDVCALLTQEKKEIKKMLCLCLMKKYKRKIHKKRIKYVTLEGRLGL
jgi:hypothetical protein